MDRYWLSAFVTEVGRLTEFRARVRLLLAALPLLAALAGCGVAGGGGSGGACGLPPLKAAIKQAPIAFVGRVTDADGYVAQVRVQQVWHGDVPARVRVRGGPVNPPPGVGGEGWHSFDVGKRYLFLPIHGEEKEGIPMYTDDDCSSTRPYTDDMASLAPPGAHPPSDR